MFLFKKIKKNTIRLGLNIFFYSCVFSVIDFIVTALYPNSVPNFLSDILVILVFVGCVGVFITILGIIISCFINRKSKNTSVEHEETTAVNKVDLAGRKKALQEKFGKIQRGTNKVKKINLKEKYYILWINDSASFEVHSTIIDIAKLLFNDGFEFCSAKTGGGTSEISHSGVDSYNVKYTDFAAFENNFFDDYSNAEYEAHKNTGGWVSFLDYENISIYLKKGNVRFCVIASKNKRILIRAYDFDNSFDTDLVVKNIIDLLGKQVETENMPCYIETDERIIKNMKQFETYFLANWTNEQLD